MDLEKAKVVLKAATHVVKMVAQPPSKPKPLKALLYIVSSGEVKV